MFVKAVARRPSDPVPEGITVGGLRGGQWEKMLLGPRRVYPVEPAKMEGQQDYCVTALFISSRSSRVSTTAGSSRRPGFTCRTLGSSVEKIAQTPRS